MGRYPAVSALPSSLPTEHQKKKGQIYGKATEKERAMETRQIGHFGKNVTAVTAFGHDRFI